MPQERYYISVLGGDPCSAEAAYLAEEVGRELARRGAVLFCGGGGGVMEAVCRGAVAEGGITVGILPEEHRRGANPYVQIPIPTGLGYARNVLVARAGQAVIAIDGSYGTLSEISLALNFGIPVVGLKTWQVVRDTGEVDPGIVIAATPQEAVEKAMALAQASGR